MVEMAICMGPVSIATNLGCCDDLPRSPCPSSVKSSGQQHCELLTETSSRYASIRPSWDDSGERLHFRPIRVAEDLRS
jgi:hypothetical protein